MNFVEHKIFQLGSGRKDTCTKVMTNFKRLTTDTGKDISVCRGAFIRKLLWERMQWMMRTQKYTRGIPVVNHF